MHTCPSSPHTWPPDAPGLTPACPPSAQGFTEPGAHLTSRPAARMQDSWTGTPQLCAGPGTPGRCPPGDPVRGPEHSVSALATGAPLRHRGARDAAGTAEALCSHWCCVPSVRSESSLWPGADPDLDRSWGVLSACPVGLDSEVLGGLSHGLLALEGPRKFSLSGSLTDQERRGLQTRGPPEPPCPPRPGGSTDLSRWRPPLCTLGWWCPLHRRTTGMSRPLS